MRTLHHRTSMRASVAAAALVSLSLALAGCTIGASVSPTTPRPQATAGADPTPRPGSIASLGEPEELTTGLEAPWGLTFLPDGSALVSERISGRILRIPAGGGEAEPVGIVPGVEVSSEGGLLGIVASPEFAADRTVFAS